ncbi:MAG: hypothetical protein GEV10_30130 [Streptosporangiales bacterium]|nr:hypothetical protein [Streptosporangiales bacterium]
MHNVCRRTCLVPDLDDELTAVLSRFEEMLIVLVGRTTASTSPCHWPRRKPSTPRVGSGTHSQRRKVGSGRARSPRDAVWFGKGFADVVHDHAHREEPPDAVVSGAARLQRLLELDWTADAKLLADRITESGTADLVLDVVGESAYRRIARRTHGAWTGNSVLDGSLD